MNLVTLTSQQIALRSANLGTFETRRFRADDGWAAEFDPCAREIVCVFPVSIYGSL